MMLTRDASVVEGYDRRRSAWLCNALLYMKYDSYSCPAQRFSHISKHQTSNIKHNIHYSLNVRTALSGILEGASRTLPKRSGDLSSGSSE